MVSDDTIEEVNLRCCEAVRHLCIMGFSYNTWASFGCCGDNIQGQETTGEIFLANWNPRAGRPRVQLFPVVVWCRQDEEAAKACISRASLERRGESSRRQEAMVSSPGNRSGSGTELPLPIGTKWDSKQTGEKYMRAFLAQVNDGDPPGFPCYQTSP